MASHSGSGDAGQAKGRNGDALEAELQRLAAERNAALAHQAATSEILKIIAASPGDTQPVFQAIAESARRLSGAMSAAVTTVADEMIRLAAFTSSDEAGALAFRQAFPAPTTSGSVHGVVLRTGQPAYYSDTESDPRVPEEFRALAKARGYRSVLAVPLIRDGAAIGAISAVTRSATPSGAVSSRISTVRRPSA